MKRELGIARCGLACCLCSENENCRGCSSEECPDRDRCENRKCSIEQGYGHCFDCGRECRKGLLAKIKPYWTVWNAMNKTASSTTARESWAITMTLRMWKS